MNLATLSEQQTTELLDQMGIKLRAGVNVKDIHKALTTNSLPGTDTGMFPYNLEEQAMLLIPERTPLSNRGLYSIKGGEEGVNKEYRAVIKANSKQYSGHASEATVSNTGRGVALKYNNLQRKKNFAYTAPESSVSLIEELTGGKFDAVGAFELASLVAAREIEERQIIGSCSTPLGTTTGLVGTAFASGGSLAALATYRVAVAPINYWLWWKYLEANTTADIPVLGAVIPETGAAPGANSRFGEGISQSTGDIGVVAGGRIEATWDDIPGAMSWAVYLSPDSGVTWYLVGLASSNAFTIKTTKYRPTLPVVLAVPATGFDDTTFDNFGFGEVLDGFFQQTVLDPDVPGFVNPTVGTLTSTSAGSGCAEVNEYFRFANRNFGYSPDVAWCGPATLDALSAVVLGSGAPAYRLNKEADKDGYIDAGTILRGVFNQYSQKVVETFSHPLLPEGHIYFYKQRIPYPQARIPTGSNMVYHNVVRFFKQRFARTTAVNMSGPWAITSYGGFVQYFPSGNGVLKGIKVSQQ